jgi:hypothetical protein
MQTIGTNSIRVYHVNPYMDHTACMNAFASAGIYIWLDLDTFNTSIKSDAPSWTETQFLAFTQVMDAFHQYDNLGGFWIGNEVIYTESGSGAGPFIKAAISDVKSYMALKNYRSIPIGYSAADIASLRPMTQNYLACSSNALQNIDFFGLNSYEWCGDVDYNTSGYANLQNMSALYPLPIFFSETGCNVPRPRSFADQAAIFGPNMVGTWSGSIIYEWVQEANDYGLVTYPQGGVTGAPIPIQPDFGNLQSQWKSASPSGVAEGAYTPSLSAPACPAATPGGWVINGDVAVPTLGGGIVQSVASSRPAYAPAETAAATTTYVLSGTGLPTTMATTTGSGGSVATTGPSGASASPTGNAGYRLEAWEMQSFVTLLGVLVAVVLA